MPYAKTSAATYAVCQHEGRTEMTYAKTSVCTNEGRLVYDAIMLCCIVMVSWYAIVYDAIKLCVSQERKEAEAAKTRRRGRQAHSGPRLVLVYHQETVVYHTRLPSVQVWIGRKRDRV